jgi:hypothetical protein
MKNENGEQVNVYNADESGSLIGLCTFGSETIGLSEVVSPDSGVDVPRFVAKNDAVPPATTHVRVRVQPVGKWIDPSVPTRTGQPAPSGGTDKNPVPAIK